MSRLKIYIPSSWRVKEDACPWVLMSASGSQLSRGDSAFSEMPKGDESVVIAPAARVLLLDAKLPKGNRRQLRQALPFAVEDRITADPETIHVVAGTTRADGTTALAVVDKGWLRRVVNALHDAGILPRRMLVETLAPPLEPGAWTVIWREREGFVRTGEASGLALEGPLELALAMREQQKPEKIVVRPQSSLPDLAHWTSELGVPVVPGARWDWAQADNSEINLLQGDFAGNGTGNVLTRLRPVFALAAIIAVVHFAITIYDWARLRNEARQLNVEIEKTFRTAFPDAKVIVDAPLQMQRNLDALKRASGQAGGTDFIPLLANAAQTLKTSASLRAVNYEQERLKLDVRLPESGSAEQLLQALKNAGLSATLDSMNVNQDAVEARYSIARPAR
jgi:general secretion pathway protein L